LSKIINDKKSQKHIIKPYNFKPLEENSSEYNDEFVTFSNNINNEKFENPSENVSNDLTQNETKTNSEIIDNLLEKIEELSNNFVKAQISFEEEIKKCHQDSQQKIKESFEEGYQKAKKECKKECDEKLENTQKLYQDSIKKLEEITAIFNKKIEDIEKELVSVALDIAKEVLQKEVTEDSKNIALSLAKSLLNDIKEASKVTIKVNPEDANFIKENIKDIEIIPDEAVKKGGIVILSDVGNIDGDIEERFNTVKEAILNK